MEPLSKMILVGSFAVCLAFALPCRAQVYEVTKFTPSYKLPPASFAGKHPVPASATTDGKWSIANDGFSDTTGPYLVAAVDETISEPLGLSLKVNNGAYDVYLRMHQHGTFSAAEVALTSPENAADYFQAACSISTRVGAYGTSAYDIFVGREVVDDGVFRIWLGQAVGQNGTRVAIDHIKLVKKAANAEVHPATEYRVVRAFDIASEPACMPSITRAPNGDVLIAFGSEWEPVPPGGMTSLIVSKDQGKTWSKRKLLWKAEDPRVTLQTPCGFQTLSNGDLLLPVSYCLYPMRKDVDPGETRPWRKHIHDPKHPDFRREARFLRSSDNGETWTREDPKLHTPTALFGRLLETRDGRLILNGYGWGAAWYWESRDLGKTWGPRMFLPKGCSSEWNMVEAANGILFTIVRGAGHPPRRTFGTNFFRNRGKTWSKPRSARVQGKMPDLLVLPSGRILMAVGLEGLSDGNDLGTIKHRNSFCVLFISDNHGKTWKRDLQFKQVNPGSDIIPVDGPGLVLLDDGRVLVVLQAQDRSKIDDPLFGYNVGMSLIGNIIELASGK